MRNTRISLLAATAMMAAVAGASAMSPKPLRNAFKAPRLPTVLRGKRYPQMVTSSDAEIAEWNRNVNSRQVRRRALRGQFVQS